MIYFVNTIKCTKSYIFIVDATGLKEVDQVRESQEKVVHALQVQNFFTTGST